MPLSLPRPDFGVLPRAPLELVVCQVRHDNRPLEAITALAIQEALGGRAGAFPRIDQVEIHTASLAMVPGIVTPGQPEVAKGWHLKSADGTWTVALLPEQFSLETTRYTNWSEFRTSFEKLVEAVEEIAAPTIELRLGIRYVDRITGLPASKPSDWARWIHASILGPPLHDALGASVISVRQQIDLDLGDARSCVLRHGTVMDPASSSGDQSVYLLDFDIYRQEARRFAGAEILSVAEDFHSQADALFAQVITPDLLSYLSGDNNV